MRGFYEFNNSAVNERLQSLLGVKLRGAFLSLTPAKTLAAGGVKVETALTDGNSLQKALSITSTCSERQLSDLLCDGEAEQVTSIALAAMLLYTILLRYQATVAPGFDAWHQNHVQDRFADVCLPSLLKLLREDRGDDWWHRPNCEIIEQDHMALCSLQHQTMSYARGSGGSAPLFQIDGNTVIGTATDYSDPAAPNVRLGSALQILVDLDFVGGNNREGYSDRRGPGLVGQTSRN